MAILKDTPGYWHGRADEARAIADHMMDPAAKETMLRIARTYETLAARAASYGHAEPDENRVVEFQPRSRAPQRGARS